MTRFVLALPAFLAVGPLFAQPSIFEVFNAASYLPPGLPNSAIAQGSIFFVSGTNLGPAATLSALRFPLQTSLGNTSASVTVGGTTVSPLVFSTSAGWVTLLMPSSTPVGSGTMTITYNGQTSAAAPVNVSAASFGMLTLNRGGFGPALVTDANYNFISLIHAATAGQELAMWGTGLGKIGSDESEPPPQGLVGTAPTVWVGGQQASVVYWGRAGCCAGLDQVNFVVPTGVAGCYVSLAVQTGNVVSNFGSIAVAGSSGGACSDPGGLSAAQIALAQNGQSINVATLSMMRSTVTVNQPPAPPTATTTDSATATFLRYTPAQLISSSFGQLVSAGSCMVYAYLGDPALGLDAGGIAIGGSNGNANLSQTGKGYYYSSGNLPNGFLDVAQHTFSASGGADVGTFAQQLTMPPALAWSSQSSISTVSESQGVTVNWTNAVPNGYVTVTGSSTFLYPGHGGGPRFSCTAPAGANGRGQFTVPPYVLLSLPVSAGSSSSPNGFLGISSNAMPSAPFATVSGIDAAFGRATIQIMQNVTYTP